MDYYYAHRRQEVEEYICKAASANLQFSWQAQEASGKRQLHQVLDN
jgi:hypothetical protein